MNLIRTSNAFWDAKEPNTFISLDNAEPPPAKSDNALMAIKVSFVGGTLMQQQHFPYQ